MGMITDSEIFRIIEKTPGEKLAGVVPTCEAILPTCSLTESKMPVKLFMIPLTSIFFSHSAIC